MQLDFNGLLYAVSYALDCVEGELVGAQTGHGKWVAYISVLLGKKLQYTQDELLDLAACAALHDNALTLYIAEERKKNEKIGSNVGMHCILGQENIKEFPFRTDVSDVILYHHENIDGSGPFGKKEEEIPMMSQIIHLADTLDINCRFQEISVENHQKIMTFLEKRRGSWYSDKLVEAFKQTIPVERYLELADYKIEDLLKKSVPGGQKEYSFEQVEKIMHIFSKIIDYKSMFTRLHSEQLAQKLVKMAEYYGYSKEKTERLYVAGILHDIGKMAVGNDILEKPAKLNEEEFVQMKNHAWYTYVILSQIEGFEDITQWASRHHEKLNGKGYPFGLTAEQLSKEDRLIGCIDIYQALSEDRPYKNGMSHDTCMSIMRNMVREGYIDADITEDVAKVMQS